MYHNSCCITPSPRGEGRGEAVPNLSASTDLEALAAELTKLVYNSNGIPEGSISTKAVMAFANRFLEGLDIGLTDWETPNAGMLESLQKNIWHFSAAKNYTQLKQLSEALIGPDGKMRTFAEFKPLAYAINDKHVNQWLKAEYGLAVNGSQMAGQWQQIVDNKEILPLLEYDAVIDAQTTDLCRDLNGTTLPVDHPFWSINYPPNHFGPCRSKVRQKASGIITRDIPSADIPKMFQTNLGKQQLIFPPKHPYFDGLPHEVKEAADKLFKEQNG